jgi:P-type Ca2+ transporter type 2C
MESPAPVRDPYRLSIQDTYEAFDTSASGLTDEEVALRLAKYGPNEIQEAKKKPIIYKLFAQFYHLMAILLWVAAVFSFVSDQAQLGYAIIGVIILNAFFSFYQEYKAEKAVEALKKLLPRKARVVRNGAEQEIMAADLVPGDIVLLNEGDAISADARVTDASELRTNNATLTGESEPVRKSADTIDAEDMIITHSPNLAFAGTSVAFGSGRGVVFATGMNTQFGKIATLTQSVKEELSPLQVDLNRLVRLIAIVAFASGIALFLLATWITGEPFIKTATLAIGLMVANVPEGLLPTVTLGLALGVSRLAKKHAIVKKLSSVETLGSTTVICTDKTGTLTQNEMTVRSLWTEEGDVEVTGVGYEPTGEFLRGEKAVDAMQDKVLLALFRAAGFANNARLLAPKPDGGDDGKWTILGDPTEAALLVTARKGGYDYDAEFQRTPRFRELPFDSKRKMMTSIHLEGRDQVAYVKGAPKEVLDQCSKVMTQRGLVDLDKKLYEQIMARNDEYARKALRVLAFACRTLPDKFDDYTTDGVEKDLVLIGLMAMIDPPRPEVEAAVKECHEAHIRIIMITGDYGLTAESIARRIGLVADEVPAEIITGIQLDEIDDQRLKEILAGEGLIFARVAPEHKMRVVSILKDMGEVVAVTGDGVNDAPALKQADIGVAMGIAGTDVSKEAAEMIITDDNFATIVNAIEEGRTVFDNVRKFVLYIFAHLTPEITPFLGFVFFGGKRVAVPMLITVMFILAIDLGTETLPALALGVESPEPGIMKRPPRTRGEPILTKGMIVTAWLFIGGIEGVLVVVSGLWDLYRLGWHPGYPVLPTSPAQVHSAVEAHRYFMYQHATTLTWLALVSTQVGNVFASRTRRASIFHIGFFRNMYVIYGVLFEVAFALLVIYAPFMQRIFGSVALGWQEWAFVAPFPFIIVLADEARKAVLRTMDARKAEQPSRPLAEAG